MQWSGGQNAGFSTATASALYSQPIADPVYGYAAVNVAAQLRDPSSLLHWMRNLIRLRKQFKVFGRGTLQFVPSSNPKILAYVRRWGDDTVLCVANVSRQVQPVELDLSSFEGTTPVEMLGYTTFPRVARAPYFLSLGSYGFAWFELRGAPPGGGDGAAQAS
jgi:maltose alpha-D-glucosyltransferase/alpha-amylase